MTNHYWDRVTAPHADRDRTEPPTDRDAVPLVEDEDGAPLPEPVQQVVRDLLAQAWDEGCRFGRVYQFDADWDEHPMSPLIGTRRALVANLDSAARMNMSDPSNPYREGTQ